MKSIKVLGHNPPDTDSTCSPIVYAWYLKEIKGMDAQAFITAQPNREAEYVLKTLNIPLPEMISSVDAEDKLVLIDTNNPEELVSGWDTAEIIEIVDHHKLFGLKSEKPIKVTMRPYGCVSTVLWEIMPEAHDKLPKEMAALMLAPLLSDTLKFTSPTTTEFDREVAAKLAAIAGLNIDDFAAEMFAAKSNLEGMSPKDILTMDTKNFEFGGKKYKISVLETTDPAQALGMFDALNDAMTEMVKAEGLEGGFFFVVDILKSEAKLMQLSVTDTIAAEKAFNAEFIDGVMTLPGVVSRKKQIVPAFEKVLN